jgi:hypothetical protein
MSSISANPGAGSARVHENFGGSATSTRPPFPAQAKFTIRCQEFRPLVRNTLRGFAEIHIAELKLTIRDIAMHRKGERCWAQLPAKPQVKDGALVRDDFGKIQYVHLMHFDSRVVSDAFSAAVVKAVLEYAPDAFEEGGV